jgi:hypothetical protein
LARVNRVLARALLPLLAVALVLPAAASAGTVTQRDKGSVSNRTVKRFDLSRAERRALDIATTKVTGAEGQGVQVEVTFKGNLERRLGRGHLKRAAIAVILRPKSRRSRPTVLATRGAGLRQRLLRRSRSKKVGALRNGRKLTFFLRGNGFSGVDAVEVKAFPRLPGQRRRARSAQQLSGPLLTVFLRNRLIADLERIEGRLDDADPSQLTCPELAEALEDLKDLDDQLQELRANVRTARRNLNSELRRARGRGDGEAVEEIEDVLDDLDELQDQIDATEDALDELRSLVEERLRLCVTVLVLAASFNWQFFDPTEVYVPDAYFFRRNQPAQAAQSSSPITAVRVIVPRQITNFICPSKLPSGTLSSTDQSNDTLTCRSSTGGSIALEERFSMNLRTSPNPSSGMGGRVLGEQDGSFKGPFSIGGP